MLQKSCPNYLSFIRYSFQADAKAIWYTHLRSKHESEGHIAVKLYSVLSGRSATYSYDQLKNSSYNVALLRFVIIMGNTWILAAG